MGSDMSGIAYLVLDQKFGVREPPDTLGIVNIWRMYPEVVRLCDPSIGFRFGLKQ